MMIVPIVVKALSCNVALTPSPRDHSRELMTEMRYAMFFFFRPGGPRIFDSS